MRTLIGSAAVLGLAWLSACSSESAAREALEKEGYTEVQLQSGGDAYTWTGRKGDSACTGTIAISSTPFSEQSRVQAQCVHSSVTEAEASVVVPSSTPFTSTLDEATQRRLAYDQGPQVAAPEVADALPAISAIKALATGDRAWLSARSSSTLRTELRKDTFTLLHLLLSGPEPISLELDTRRTEADGLRVSNYRITVGESTLALEVAYGANEYRGFHIGGSGYTAKAIQRIDTLETMALLGTYLITASEEIVTQPRVGQGPLTVRLSLAGFAHPDGEVRASSRHTVEHNGTTTENVRAPSTLKTDGILHLDIPISDLNAGQYRITGTITDEHTAAVLETETVVDVLP